jgi:hypothetical protein
LLPNWDRGLKKLGAIRVPVTTLDIAIEQFGVPAFCKIDVEGFEVEVLKGLSHAITNLSLEYHRGPQGIKNLNECLDILVKGTEYKLNLTGLEGTTFLSPRWLTVREFKDSFPECAKGNVYGEVFLHPA